MIPKSQKLQEGIILLVTMMMLMIITILTLSLMREVFVYINSGNQVISTHKALYQMESIVNNLNLSENVCIIDNKNANPNEIIALLASQKGCIIKDGKSHYRYLVADLGNYPCLQINSLGSHHWLVTIVSLQPPLMYLQLRITKAEKMNDCQLSLNEIVKIHQGVVSWRQIKYFT